MNSKIRKHAQKMFKQLDREHAEVSQYISRLEDYRQTIEERLMFVSDMLVGEE